MNFYPIILLINQIFQVIEIASAIPCLIDYGIYREKLYKNLTPLRCENYNIMHNKWSELCLGSIGRDSSHAYWKNKNRKYMFKIYQKNNQYCVLPDVHLIKSERSFI